MYSIMDTPKLPLALRNLNLAEQAPAKQFSTPPPPPQPAQAPDVAATIAALQQQMLAQQQQMIAQQAELAGLRVAVERQREEKFLLATKGSAHFAIKLQSCARRVLARARLERARRAASVLQTATRGALAYRLLQRARTAAVSLQARARRHGAVASFALARHASRRTQACARRLIAISAYRRARLAIIDIQRVARRLLPRRELNAARCSATAVARTYRGHRARRANVTRYSRLWRRTTVERDDHRAKLKAAEDKLRTFTHAVSDGWTRASVLAVTNAGWTEAMVTLATANKKWLEASVLAVTNAGWTKAMVMATADKGWAEASILAVTNAGWTEATTLEACDDARGTALRTRAQTFLANVKAETEELRVDPTYGCVYTKEEFVEDYGGTAEWDAAARGLLRVVSYDIGAQLGHTTCAEAPPRASGDTAAVTLTPAPTAPVSVDEPITTTLTEQEKLEPTTDAELRVLIFGKPCFAVLKQVHPDSELTATGAAAMNDLLCDFAMRLAAEVAHLPEMKKWHFDAAVTIMFHESGKLAEHAISEGTKAVYDYEANLAKGVDRSTAAARGLVFPVVLFSELLTHLTGKAADNCAAVYITGCVEYIAAEVLELAGNCDALKKFERPCICAASVHQAVSDDDELARLFSFIDPPLAP